MLPSNTQSASVVKSPVSRARNSAFPRPREFAKPAVESQQHNDEAHRHCGKQERRLREVGPDYAPYSAERGVKRAHKSDQKNGRDDV